MKVLVVVAGPAQGSGVRTAAEQLSRAMVEAGHQVRVCPIDVRSRRSGNRVNVENVTGVLRDAWTVARAVRRNRPDIVWFHTLGFPLLPALRTLVVVSAIRVSGGRTVAHLHAYGLDPQSLTQHRWSRFAVHSIGRLVDRVVVLHDAASQAVGAVVGVDRVVELPNMVDTPREPAPLPLGSRLRLVFVGGLVRRKGVPELLEAMRGVDADVELHIVGGPGEDGAVFAETLRRGAGDLVDLGKVVFEGKLDDAGVREQLRAADVFVLPSHAEGTPIALLEAMAEGRPAIVSDAGDMGDIVRRADCGVVLPAVSSLEIGRSIGALEQRRSGLSATGARGRAYVQRRHSRGALTPVMADVLVTAHKRGLVRAARVGRGGGCQ